MDSPPRAPQWPDASAPAPAPALPALAPSPASTEQDTQHQRLSPHQRLCHHHKVRSVRRKSVRMAASRSVRCGPAPPPSRGADRSASRSAARTDEPAAKGLITANHAGAVRSSAPGRPCERWALVSHITGGHVRPCRYYTLRVSRVSAVIAPADEEPSYNPPSSTPPSARCMHTHTPRRTTTTTAPALTIALSSRPSL